MADKKNSKKKNTGLSLACVILAVLVLFIVFLVKKDSILTNLKETRFFDRVFGSTPEFVENHTPSEKDSVKIPLVENDEITIKVEPKTTPSTNKSTSTESPIETKTETQVAKETEKKADKEAVKETVAKEEKPAVAEPKVEAKATTDIQLCFIEIDADGSINRKMVKRSVAKNDSPLTTALKELLAGPDTTKSAERNCMSVIPKGTKLLSIKIEDGVAYLNFNEQIEFNDMGSEGGKYSLEQIVFTATAFSTVNEVQFLIEGEKKIFLGSEAGYRIDVPLSRNKILQLSSL